MLEILIMLLCGAVGGGLASFILNKIKTAGHYALKCQYPGCDFLVAVSDEKYSYICDDLMADHQNRQHPLEFKETY